jgi:hypothetical protein
MVKHLGLLMLLAKFDKVARSQVIQGARILLESFHVALVLCTFFLVWNGIFEQSEASALTQLLR